MIFLSVFLICVLATDVLHPSSGLIDEVVQLSQVNEGHEFRRSSYIYLFNCNYFENA